MTDNQTLPVSQEAREAAGSLYAEMNGLDLDHYYIATLTGGSCDNHEIVQAFAHFEQRIVTRERVVGRVIDPLGMRYDCEAGLTDSPAPDQP